MDGAIHRAAGPMLREFNSRLGGCATGQAKISPGFKLPCRWIIHTVGPVWRGGGQGEARLLESCYRQCFGLALESGVRSIAFPGISTGIYGYPREAAAQIALSVMRDYESRFDEIIACCFSAADAVLYESLLAEPPA